MARLAELAVGIVLICCGASAANTTRYFKMDHGTGAMYVALSPSGGYTLTAREHVGVFVEESGQWSESGTLITFRPKRPAKASYSALEVRHGNRTFLALKGESAPGIEVPAEETERELDQHPKELPSLVFFEVDAKVYRADIKRPYPFRTLGIQPLTSSPKPTATPKSPNP